MLRDIGLEPIKLQLQLQRQLYIDRTLDLARDLCKQWLGEKKLAFVLAYSVANHRLCLLLSSKQSKDVWVGDGF